MIDMKLFAKTMLKGLNDNSPTILSAIAVGGVVSTTVMAVRVTPEAMRLIQEAKDGYGSDYEVQLTKFDTVKIAWKPYLPVVIMGGATIACVIGANTIGNRRSAAMISAYTLSEKALTEYRAKVVETIGETKETAIRDEIAKDRITNDPPSNHEVMVVGSGEILCYDTLSGRYFKSDMETIKAAVNSINAILIYDTYASLNDFYNKLGLDPISIGEELGWKIDNLLELSYSTRLTADNRPCVTITFTTAPIRNYWNSKGWR